MGRNAELYGVNKQCSNCYHFWATKPDEQKGKCTNEKSVDHKKLVNNYNVCDLFEAI